MRFRLNYDQEGDAAVVNGKRRTAALVCIGLLTLLAACQSPAPADAPATDNLPKVLAVESFLADMAQNVAGDRLHVDTLMPLGLDPHAYEPTPQDVTRVADADVLLVNGRGFEGWLDEVLANAGGERLVIEASAGLTPRTPGTEEAAVHAGETGDHAVDPHFWLDPTKAVQYVENIRNGLISADPGGQAAYTANAAAYITKLKELDAVIQEQIAQIPEDRRLLVTNHESLGYYADRYGLRIVGAVSPSSSSSASPSAQQLAQLADLIRSSGAPAIFLETGANAQLADQLQAETGITVAPPLYTHSITAAGGAAPTYLDMMRYNTQVIVNALK